MTELVLAVLKVPVPRTKIYPKFYVLNKEQVYFKFPSAFFLCRTEKSRDKSQSKRHCSTQDSNTFPPEETPDGLIPGFKTKTHKIQNRNLPWKLLILPLFDSGWTGQCSRYSDCGPGQCSRYSYSLRTGRLRVRSPVGARNFIFYVILTVHRR